MSDTGQAAATREGPRTAGLVIPSPRESPGSTTSSENVSAVRGGVDHLAICYPGVRYALERLGSRGLL